MIEKKRNQIALAKGQLRQICSMDSLVSPHMTIILASDSPFNKILPNCQIPLQSSPYEISHFWPNGILYSFFHVESQILKEVEAV